MAVKELTRNDQKQFLSIRIKRFVNFTIVGDIPMKEFLK